MDPQIPATETYSKYRFETPLRIFTRDNKLIGEFGDRRTIPIAFEDTPKAYIDALLNTEDKRFFEHRGVDLISLANDVVGLFLSDVRTGASTITMQLAKIISFSPEQTFIRKFKEMLLAVKIEQALTKEQILELYINIAPLGKHAYGVQAGAHTYYGKPVGELNLAQIAMLAAVSKRPEAGNPINGPEYAVRRRNLVLRRMLDQASISRAEYEEAVAAPISAVVHRRDLDLVAPFPAEWVRQQLVERYGTDIYAGYEAVTTLDSKLQLAAQQALRTGLEAYDRRHGYRGAVARVEVPPEFTVPEVPPLAVGALSAGVREGLPLARGALSAGVREGPPLARGALRAGVREGLPLAVGATAFPAPPPPADGQAQAGAVGQQSAEGAEAALPAPLDLPQHFEGTAAFRAFTTSALGDRPTVQGKEPAVVLALATRRMLVARADATTLVLPWDGLRWARRYLSVDAMAARPQTAAEVAEIGDVVYIERDNGAWRLAQVPDIAGALVALDTHDGAVRAIVGGYDFVGNQFDHALQARRQPGSGFKPFVYSAALENGVTPASVFLDAPLVFRDPSTGRTYRPRNDSGRYNGPTRLREALYRSINLVSIRVMLRIGADNILRHAGQFGFRTGTFPDNTQLAIGGGTMGVTPLEMATAYAAIANGGYAVQPRIIERVRTIDGDTVFEPPRTAACDPCSAGEGAQPVVSPAPRAISAQNAFIMDSMLRDVVRRGTGRRALVLERSDIAGKTGTTDEAVDTWFNGYHPKLAATTWVGFSRARPLGAREYGSTTPLAIWVDFMRQALAEEPEEQRIAPDGVVRARVDAATGQAASPDNRRAMFEYFLADNAPETETATQRSNADTATVRPEDIF